MSTNQLLKTTQREESEEDEYVLLRKNSSTTHLQRRKQKTNQQNHAWFYLGLVGNIGYTISVPIAGGAIIGSLIDRTWSTYPNATLVCLFLGIIVSMLGFIGIVRKIIAKKI
jgi:predicted F0F1-ATPase subunit